MMNLLLICILVSIINIDKINTDRNCGKLKTEKFYKKMNHFAFKLNKHVLQMFHNGVVLVNDSFSFNIYLFFIIDNTTCGNQNTCNPIQQAASISRQSYCPSTIF